MCGTTYHISSNKMKFTALEHKEQLSRSFLMLFATIILLRLLVPYFTGLWSPLYMRNHKPGRIMGSLKNSNLILWMPDKYPKQGAQHLSPHTEVLCPSVQALPQAQYWLQEPLGPRRQHWQAQASAKVQQQPHTALKPLPELLTQSRNSILLEVSASHANLLSRHAQVSTWLAISAPAALSP